MAKAPLIFMKKGPYGPFFCFFANGDVPSPGNEGAPPLLERAPVDGEGEIHCRRRDGPLNLGPGGADHGGAPWLAGRGHIDMELVHQVGI
ncbi:hypothetical protein D3C77_684840 [compost metagenome]